jgi:dTDP-glucose 4,6-dehydratase
MEYGNLQIGTLTITKNKMTKSILITGGAGFIGSHVVKLFVEKYPNYTIVNLDALTYAGNLENLKEVENSKNYTFVKADIQDAAALEEIFEKHKITDVIHLAAESHVDRSISDPLAFVLTNVIGTVNLLNAAKNAWKGELDKHLFYHVSTDEVYGSLHDGGFFLETTAYDPQSPYSASKASSDHFVRAYANTYKMRTVVSNCSNNYGPNHFPEKLIPLCIHNIKNNKPLPVYGKGENVRDWLFVKDHARAIDMVFHQGKDNETYNIGGFNEWKNIDIVRLLCQKMDHKLGRAEGTSEKLITYVTDRAGHDLRYAIDATKIQKELGWEPSLQFEEGIELTIDWYLENQDWLDHVTSGSYKDYYQELYENR